MLGQFRFVGLEFGIFAGFRWIHSSVWVDEPGFGRVKIWFFQIWPWVWPVSGKTGMKFGLFGGVRMGLKLCFGGRTWVRMSSKFYLSNSKLSEVHYTNLYLSSFDPTLYLIVKPLIVQTSLIALFFPFLAYCGRPISQQVGISFSIFTQWTKFYYEKTTAKKY